MSSSWGTNIQLSLFGESHGAAIGGVIGSLPAGFVIDFEQIAVQMRRRNHRAAYTTNRSEGDEVEVLSGVYNGKTTGSPVGFLIRNGDVRSKDYQDLNRTPRPGHADYPAAVKFGGNNDYRGGGHFSGRITAPLVFAGSIARQILTGKGITVVSHVASVGTVQDEPLGGKCPKQHNLAALTEMDFPLLNEQVKPEMLAQIQAAQSQGDSIGGVVECGIYGLPVGLGEPFFHSVESQLAAMLFSIPAVKGVEFGDGFALAAMKGSQSNDAYEYHQGSVSTQTNHNGGILGGLTNGQPLLFRVAIKATPSIFQDQHTVDLVEQKDTTLVLKGRHDACIVPRGAAVVEAAAALVMLDIGRNLL